MMPTMIPVRWRVIHKADFVEEKHPRRADGEFVPKGSGGGGAKIEAPAAVVVKRPTIPALLGKEPDLFGHKGWSSTAHGFYKHHGYFRVKVDLDEVSGRMKVYYAPDKGGTYSLVSGADASDPDRAYRMAEDLLRTRPAADGDTSGDGGGDDYTGLPPTPPKPAYVPKRMKDRGADYQGTTARGSAWSYESEAGDGSWKTITKTKTGDPRTFRHPDKDSALKAADEWLEDVKLEDIDDVPVGYTETPSMWKRHSGFWDVKVVKGADGLSVWGKKPHDKYEKIGDYGYADADAAFELSSKFLKDKDAFSGGAAPTPTPVPVAPAPVKPAPAKPTPPPAPMPPPVPADYKTRHMHTSGSGRDKHDYYRGSTSYGTAEVYYSIPAGGHWSVKGFPADGGDFERVYMSDRLEEALSAADDWLEGKKPGAVPDPGGGEPVPTPAAGTGLKYRPDKSTIARAKKVALTDISDLRGMPGITPEKVETTFKEWMKGKQVTRFMEDDHLLELLTSKDKRFKSQFETGHSGGYMSPETRRRAEKRGLGLPEDLPHRERPIYGFIEGGATSYGNCRVFFKHSVDARTTITCGDSLSDFESGSMVGTPFLDPGLEGVDSRSRSVVARDAMSMSYVESQTYGGIGIDEVDKVVFHTSRTDRRTVTKIKAELDKLGIPYEER